MYKVLVTGCRDWADEDIVFQSLTALENHHGQIRVVCGDCKTGADKMARDWAASKGYDRDIHVFRADWSRGRRGGPERNQNMVDRGGAVVCLAFWDGKSRGTLDCLTRAVAAGIPVTVLPA